MRSRTRQMLSDTTQPNAWRRKYSMMNKMTAAVLCVLFLVAGCDNKNGPFPDSDRNQRGVSDRSQNLQVDLTFDAQSDPTHIWYGKGINLYMEWCDYSGKQIRSRRYGAVLVDQSGNLQRFRSVESMIRKLADEGKTKDDYELVGIVDFISAEKLFAPEKLTYHISRNLPSPDGGNISGLNPEADQGLLFNIGEAYPGKRISWDEVWEMVVNEKS